MLPQHERKRENIVGAVLDNGCQIDHEDLKWRVNVGRNFTTNPNNYSDINSYETHVAGTIAVTEKDQGILGVASQAKLLFVKIFRRF